MKIETVEDLDTALDQGSYTSVGSYPLFFITSDGGTLLPKTVQANKARIVEAIMGMENSGWRVVAIDVNWEDPALFDDHTNERIESAYAEAEVEHGV